MTHIPLSDDPDKWVHAELVQEAPAGRTSKLDGGTAALASHRDESVLELLDAGDLKLMLDGKVFAGVWRIWRRGGRWLISRDRNPLK